MKLLFCYVMISLSSLGMLQKGKSPEPVKVQQSDYEIGLAALHNNRLSDATVALERSQQKNPSAMTCYLLAVAYNRLQDVVKTVNNATCALTSKPPLQQPYLSDAQAYQSISLSDLVKRKLTRLSEGSSSEARYAMSESDTNNDAAINAHPFAANVAAAKAAATKAENSNPAFVDGLSVQAQQLLDKTVKILAVTDPCVAENSKVSQRPSGCYEHEIDKTSHEPLVGHIP